MRPDTQGAFAGALIDPDARLPAGIVDPDGAPAPKRFAVYRNNVTVSLVEALGATFVSVKALVGEDFFNAMARDYVRSTPPASPLLAQYGRTFPQHISGFEPANGLPFLYDVARLDRAWLDAYHAADVAAVPAHEFAAIDPGQLESIRLEPTPATMLVHSTYPVVSLWTAGRDNRPAAGIDPGRSEGALVTRPKLTVMVTSCSPGVTAFFKALLAGKTLGEAAEAGAEFTEFDLNEALALSISSGAFCKILTGGTKT